jgi:hypothetical protein
MYKIQQKFVIYSITIDGDNLEGTLDKTTKEAAKCNSMHIFLPPG